MKGLLLAALLAGSAAAAEAPKPAQVIGKLLAFTPPKGWTEDQYANAEGADPVLRFESLADAVQIRVFGAPGSDYPTPKDFLSGAAASTQGAAPDAAGTVLAAGRKLPLYRRRFPLELGDPHRPSSGKSPMGTEVFCVLPLKGGRYAVLAWRRESPAPALDAKGEKAWEAFLKSARPRR